MNHLFVKIQLDVNLFLPSRKKAIMEIFTNDKNIQNKLNRSEFQELLSYFKGLRESVILLLMGLFLARIVVTSLDYRL